MNAPSPAAPAATPLLTRRRAIIGLGTVGLGALLVGCGDDDIEAASPTATGTTSAATEAPATASEAATAAAATEAATAAATEAATTASSSLVDLFADDTASCLITPELTEGPYYLDLDLLRSDITESSVGLPLLMAIRVQDSDGCTPVANVPVDLWHCDALGDYSGFAQGGGGEGTTFLRGTQMTDADGIAAFNTVIPGWYTGRAVHFHFKVHMTGSRVLTSQLFFDEDVLLAVYAANEPYSERPVPDRSNANDNIYNETGGTTVVNLREGANAYVATITVGAAA